MEASVAGGARRVRAWAELQFVSGVSCGSGQGPYDRMIFASVLVLGLTALRASRAATSVNRALYRPHVFFVLQDVSYFNSH